MQERWNEVSDAPADVEQRGEERLVGERDSGQQDVAMRRGREPQAEAQVQAEQLERQLH